jgi:hypothetical protein
MEIFEVNKSATAAKRPLACFFVEANLYMYRILTPNMAVPFLAREVNIVNLGTYPYLCLFIIISSCMLQFQVQYNSASKIYLTTKIWL